MSLLQSDKDAGLTARHDSEQPRDGSTSPAKAAKGLRAAFERAFTLDDELAHRLGYAGTTVRFVAGDEEVTLLLDRHPPEVVNGDEPAEIVIELSSEQAAQYMRGSLALPAAMLAGRVKGYGEARRYLSVDPILRKLLRDLHDQGKAADGDR